MRNPKRGTSFICWLHEGGADNLRERALVRKGKLRKTTLRCSCVPTRFAKRRLYTMSCACLGVFVQQVAYKCLGARVLSELFCVHVGLRLCTWENILDAHGTWSLCAGCARKSPMLRCRLRRRLPPTIGCCSQRRLPLMRLFCPLRFVMLAFRPQVWLKNFANSPSDAQEPCGASSRLGTLSA